MTKYGIKSKDEDVLELISSSLQTKFKGIAKDLIDIGRYSQISFYLTSSKNAGVGDVNKLTTFNRNN